MANKKNATPTKIEGENREVRRAARDFYRLDFIDKKTHEIRQDEDKTIYKSLEEIADDLPDNSPRFILLSYPLTLSSGRLTVPYVLLYYLPTTCNAESRMMYAGAKELMRNTSEAGKIVDIESPEELEEVPGKLGAT